MKVKMEGSRLVDSICCLQPSRPILCTTKNEDGSDHVAPFGWCIPVSQIPPMLVLAIQHSPKKSQTLSNIMRAEEFVVNVPDISMIDGLVLSSYDTRLGENKIDRSHFTRLKSHEVNPCSIAECKANLECRVKDIVLPGDHAIVIANIICAQYEKEAYYSDMAINISKFEPVIHVSNFTDLGKRAQHHVFLNINGTITTEVDFPTKNGRGEK